MAARRNSRKSQPDNNQEDTDMSTDTNTSAELDTDVTPTFTEPNDTQLEDSDLAEDEDLDVEEPDEDLEEVEATEGTGESKGKAKAKESDKPKRGDLPEGYVTPIGFAKIVGERGLHTLRDGTVADEVKPQMIYSYMRNAPKSDPFPIEKIKDSNGVERQVLKVDEGVAWWERKNERAAGRKQNAADKAAKKESNGKQSKESGEADPSILEDAEEAE
jgi:hypothetical protein